MTLGGDTRLQEIAESLKDGKQIAQVTTRTFIGWFGAKRRSARHVDNIRAALKKHNVITVPDFQQAYIDEEISFSFPETLAQPSKSDPTKTLPIGDDPTHRINKLDAANQKPTRVKPHDSLARAVTLMMNHRYSQLPVMSNDYVVEGIISWESIGKRLALGLTRDGKENSVRDFMDNRFTVIPSGESLLSAIQKIEEDEYVLVQNSQNQISGIVTSSDLSRQFHRLGEPFLLIGEIENYIRVIILQADLTSEELAEAKNPNDTDREIQQVSDLTFGEYIRLIENKKRWGKLNLGIDRKYVVEELKRIRDIRNDVMHYDPDGIEEEQIQALRSFAELLQELAELKVIGAAP